MIEFKKQVLEVLQKSQSSPFLFVGSGFSRRYLDLPQWDELLKNFCKNEDEYDELFASSSGNLPKLAGILAERYHDRWWQSPDFEGKRSKYKSRGNGARLISKTSALRYEISEYINSLCETNHFQLREEVNLLEKINVDGIITTNWDCLLEKLFPGHEVYVGQEDLLFSNTQSVGEIYKIHGCASQHESLVLTDDDYHDFHRLNPYLAAKLITIFVEHPVVFIGYSMQDENIISLLSSIVSVLDQDKLSKLSRNLIFLQRANGSPASIQDYTLQFKERNIPATLVKTDDFSPMYMAITEIEKKIPVKLLRIYKKQFYEIVSSTQPSRRMHVVNEGELSEESEIQFVAGLTVASDAKSAIGYKGIKVIDLFKDLLNDADLHSESVLKYSIPSFSKAAKYIPIFKHLKNIGVSQKGDSSLKKYDLEDRLPMNGAEFYQSKASKERYERDASEMTCSQIIKNFDPAVAATFLPFVADQRIDIPVIEKFLNKHADKLEGGARSTPFRKLACFYDWKKNGFLLT
ncbi:SIR2 family protein [Comamonas testosteroni]|uniref:SIR2 family protein n=1 Tax=Comamonas testosteroni TaxID=285 RepID=UPI00389AAF37